jgi:predicted peptidase
MNFAPSILMCFLFLIMACSKPDEVLPLAIEQDSTADHKAIDPVRNPNVGDYHIDTGYESHKFNDMPYRMLTPASPDTTKKYPLVLFLHGIGESGFDNKRQLLWGASIFQRDSIRNKYPAYVIFPQCPVDHFWFDTYETDQLKALIDSLTIAHPIDPDKIYIGGLSMGAYGTYAMVAKNPDMFAAAIAISGDGDSRKATVMAKTEWRIFAGKKDDVVPYVKSEKMAKVLASAGAVVSFTLYPQADHEGSWINAFAEPDFCSWMFSISKQRER